MNKNNLGSVEKLLSKNRMSSVLVFLKPCLVVVLIMLARLKVITCKRKMLKFV